MPTRNTPLPNATTSHTAVSVAQKSEKQWMILYGGWESTNSCLRSIVYAITEDGGFTYTWGEIENAVWTDKPRFDILRTPFPQATAAYDVFGQ